MPAGRVKVDPVVKNKQTFATDYFKSDTEEQVWLGNAHLDNLVTVSLALGGEVWATRQRQLISEKLAEKKLPATTANIEAYVASPEEVKEWESMRKEMAKRVYQSLARSLKPLKEQG